MLKVSNKDLEWSKSEETASMPSSGIQNPDVCPAEQNELDHESQNHKSRIDSTVGALL
jgi:hypothetical protein